MPRQKKHGWLNYTQWPRLKATQVDNADHNCTPNKAPYNVHLREENLLRSLRVLISWMPAVFSDKSSITAPRTRGINARPDWTPILGKEMKFAA